MNAPQDAGRPLALIAGAAFNGTAVQCAQTAGAKGVLGPNPPCQPAETIELAVAVIEGHKPADKTVLYNAPELTTDPIKANYAEGSSVEKIELGKNVFPDLSSPCRCRSHPIG